jgi:hypothetical protein
MGVHIRIPGTGLSVTLNRARASRGASSPALYSGDGLRVEGRILDALRSERFRTAYEAGMRTPHRIGGGGDLQIEWRVHTCLWAAEHALSLQGDFVECGVNTGILSLAICTYLDFARSTRRFFLFDTFAGIPIEQASPVERPDVLSKNARIYRECYEQVRETFAPFPNVQLVRGRVPDTLSTVPIDRVAYLSIDMNLVYPEIEALEFFWDKLEPGAIVVLDDYGFAGHQAQHDAVDAFAASRSVPVYTCPTGQGLIIRPPR